MSIFEWTLKTGLTVYNEPQCDFQKCGIWQV